MHTDIKNKKRNNFIYGSIFLVLALLLITPNFSILPLLALCLYSFYYLLKNRQGIQLTSFDKLFCFALASYFIAFIPISIIDTSTFRYFDAPSRFLICIPIYLLIRHLLINQKLEFHKVKCVIEYAAIIGSFGALAIALYQTIIEGRARVDGFLFSIDFGYLACSLAFICLAFLRASKYKIINLLGFSAAIIATLLTVTRGAIFAIPILLIMTLLLAYKDKFSLLKTIGFILIFSLICTLFYQFNQTIKSRIDYTINEVTFIMSGDT